VSPKNKNPKSASTTTTATTTTTEGAAMTTKKKTAKKTAPKTTTPNEGDAAMKSKKTDPTSHEHLEVSASAASAPAATPPPVTASAPLPITSSEAAQCQTLLGQISGILGPVTPLSTDEIRRSLKLRKGGAQVVPQLVDLCKQHGVTSVGAVTPDTLSAQKARADTLNTIGVNFAAVGKALGDATFSAESSTWRQATTLYTVLQRLAVDNPTLAQGIQPVQAFFQTVRTKGTKREVEVKRKLTKAQKVAAKYEQPSGSAAAGPLPASGSTAPSAGAPNPTSAPAPAAVTPVATNGVAHS
jgi:hypothetical protein